MSNPNHINDLQIENFKSIKKMHLKPKRINIFVGKPNVGKSNILEALSLISESTEIKQTIRFENTFQLFYNNDVNKEIKIETDNVSCFITNNKERNNFDYIQYKNISHPIIHELYSTFKTEFLAHLPEFKLKLGLDSAKFNEGPMLDLKIIDQNGEVKYFKSYRPIHSRVRRYTFSDHIKTFEDKSIGYLISPYGDNLLSIILTNEELRQDISGFFNDYGLEFFVDPKNNSIELLKRKDGIGIKHEYSLIADTLRRVIFHKAAIKSNSDAILLLEEPESHNFPPYIAIITHEMIDSVTNQFFIATHSPYLLNTIIENTSFDECSINIVSYKDYQTVVRELSEKEVTEMLDYGQDVFINYDAFAQ